MVVVLPAPLCPSRAVICPSYMFMLILSTAVNALFPRPNTCAQAAHSKIILTMFKMHIFVFILFEVFVCWCYFSTFPAWRRIQKVCINTSSNNIIHGVVMLQPETDPLFISSIWQIQHNMKQLILRRQRGRARIKSKSLVCVVPANARGAQQCILCACI